ncbi:nucleolar protein 58-like [Patiria miniata]|uniref:Uncharacterized protein n=1 Tax=Patiria miniata TaxID=46514 RepID=A0A913ZFT1_PATMI|nr:nucleolar protein 58-like [Patiria miniata]
MTREKREMEGGEKTKRKSKKDKKRTKSSQEASEETSQEPTRKKSWKEKKRDKTSEESEEQLRAEPAQKKKSMKYKKRSEDKMSHPPGPSCVPKEPVKESEESQRRKADTSTTRLWHQTKQVPPSPCHMLKELTTQPSREKCRMRDPSIGPWLRQVHQRMRSMFQVHPLTKMRQATYMYSLNGSGLRERKRSHRQRRKMKRMTIMMTR